MEYSDSMVEPIQLHPKIRERKDARVSASALAEFIITTPDKQDEVLHDARFMRSNAVVPYGDAIRSIKSYCSDPYRSADKLGSVIEALNKKIQSPGFKPSQQEEAARCVEAIVLFQNSINAFGSNSTSLIAPQRFESLGIETVDVSIQPALLAAVEYPSATEKVATIFIRPQKRPDPNGCKSEEKQMERQSYRREVARYMLVMGWMLLRANGVAEKNVELKKMAVWDLRMKETIGFPSDRIIREKRIRAACGQIARLWETVEPKSGDLAVRASPDTSLY